MVSVARSRSSISGSAASASLRCKKWRSMADMSAAWSLFMWAMVFAFATGSISRALPAGLAVVGGGVKRAEAERVAARVVTMLGN